MATVRASNYESLRAGTRRGNLHYYESIFCYDP